MLCSQGSGLDDSVVLLNLDAEASANVVKEVVFLVYLKQETLRLYDRHNLGSLPLNSYRVIDPVVADGVTIVE